LFNKKRGGANAGSLRTTVAILKAQQEATLDGILVVDNDGRILSYNRRFLEIWGVPTSAPALDPTNHSFVYLRWQRGVMQYDAGCNCTQGVLLADYLKAILTGKNLPADLAAEAAASPLLNQYTPAGALGLNRPAVLPNTDMTNAFEAQSAG